MAPWPLLTRFRVLWLVLRFLFFLKYGEYFFLLSSVMLVALVGMLWAKDLSREGCFLGYHSLAVQHALKAGMVWFIVSEVFFFFGFFWAFFHRSLTPTSDLGFLWPPVGIEPLNPFQIPLLNTIILLRSGLTVTWSHHRILGNESGVVSLVLTIVLGVYFTLLQGWEYYQASFTIIDRVYGSVFFVTTGFHGIHVIIGSFLLFFILVRIIIGQFRATHHVGFELAIWYWHFVDVVWLFLFVFVYWWGF